MSWFETKDDSVRVARPAAVPMGPSLNPPPRAKSVDGSQPVMTFRPPGATPVSIAAEPDSQPAGPEIASAEPEPSTKPGEAPAGGSKVALIVLGVLVLAAIGVATGWFLTQ